MNIGKTIGVNKVYIQDGVWIRCDCGAEMLEIVQVPDDEAPTEYQFRFFCEPGLRKLSRKEQYWSVFYCPAAVIELIIQYFEEEGKDDLFNFDQKGLRICHPESGYWLTCIKDRNCNLNDIMLQTKKGKCIWDIVITDESLSELIISLKEMLKNDKEYQNGKTSIEHTESKN